MLRFNLLNFAAGACLLIVATFLAGAFYASFGRSSAIELGAVDGQVTIHGQPQPNLYVDFVPEGGGRGSQGRTDRQGNYKAVYTLDKTGALLGRQEVVISIPEKLDHSNNLISPRVVLYSADVEVRPGVNRFDFEIDD
jgi:hypothetical protein